MAETPLARRLKARIAADGPLPLDVFWQAAMTDPEGGYYTTGKPIGAGGDFTTAPEISQIFGELIGLWLAEAWIRAGRPAPFALIELGPGRGQLMADALRAARAAPDFLEAADLLLVEASPIMRVHQAAALATGKPRWASDWRDAFAGDDDRPIFLIANEFLDALPIRQFIRTGSGWAERLAATQGDSFAFTSRPVALPPPDAPDAAPEGAILEWSAERDAVMAVIGGRIARTGGAALLVDYGHGSGRIGDTLQALAGGRPADPLANPGQADITSHVDFAAASRAATDAGAAAFGPVDQGAFLLRLGAEIRAAQLTRQAPPEKAAAIALGLRRLLHPKEMGSLFKALAVLPRAAPPPAGFER